MDPIESRILENMQAIGRELSSAVNLLQEVQESFAAAIRAGDIPLAAHFAKWYASQDRVVSGLYFAIKYITPEQWSIITSILHVDELIADLVTGAHRRIVQGVSTTEQELWIIGTNLPQLQAMYRPWPID